MSAKQNNNIGKLNFEQAIKELTAIVEKIEQGEIALQDSLAEYEKGMALIKHCRGILQKAEKHWHENVFSPGCKPVSHVWQKYSGHRHKANRLLQELLPILQEAPWPTFSNAH